MWLLLKGWCWWARWNREVFCCVFADTPADDVITCSCKDRIRTFYRGGVIKKIHTQTTLKIPICCWYTHLPPSVAPGHGAVMLCLPSALSLQGPHVSSSDCWCFLPRAHTNRHLGLSKVTQLLAIEIFLEIPVSTILVRAPAFNRWSRSLFPPAFGQPCTAATHSLGVLGIFLKFQKIRPSLDVPVVLAWLIFPSFNSIYCNTCQRWRLCS